MKDKTRKNIIVTKIVLFLLTTGVIIYDLSVAIRKQWEATVSNQVATIGEHFIFIPILWGTLLAHFFFSKIGGKLFGKIPKLRYAIWIPIASFILVVCIIGCFKDIMFLKFLGNNLYIPAIFGQVLGLFWYQESKTYEIKDLKNLNSN